jgi:hypothetical protein
MGGSGDNDYEKEEKIIKNIAKNILVEKGHWVSLSTFFNLLYKIGKNMPGKVFLKFQNGQK